MHDFGHTRPFTFGLPLLVAVVCAFFSLGWGACTTTTRTCYSSYPVKQCGSGVSNSVCTLNGYFGICNRETGGIMLQSCIELSGLVYGCSLNSCTNDRNFSYTCITCNNQSDIDSLNCLRSGSLWIDGSCCDEQCVCEKDGGRWVNGECRPACNDHIAMPDKCDELWKSGYNVDGDGNPGGGGYWAIVTFECYYDSCAMSLNCTEKSNFPAGSLNCSDFQDTTGTPGRCVGTVGYQCIMQCGESTHNCDCDGSCQKALTTPACGCPQSSSSGGGSSSSGDSSSSSQGSSSSGEPGSSSGEPGSSAVEPGSSGSGSGSDWEYNYNPQFNQLVSLNTSQVGYLSDIDKQIAQLNAMGLKVDNSAVVAAVTEGTAAQTAGNDTLHSLHGTLDHIDSVLNTEVETPDVTDWLSSASNLVDNLYSNANDTASTIIGIDSLKADTSSFKSKYSSLFISGAYTRDACYEFEIKESGFLGRVGRQFKLGAKVDFSSIGGFDLCSILRGVVRAFGAILCLLITIKAYRSAFSSSDG